MDNFTWNAGFRNRFEFMHVDSKTQMCTPKVSAAWFREMAQRNAMV